MATLEKDFTATGAGTGLLVGNGDSFTYDVAGTFEGTVVLERSLKGGQTWQTIGTFTEAASGTVVVETANGQPALYRFRCSAFTSGTIETSLVDVDSVVRQDVLGNGTVAFKLTEAGVESLVRVGQKRIVNVGAKVGTTAGWVVGAADDLGLLATLPAGVTAGTLVVPVPGLKVGDTITAFHLIGQVESAGNTVTLDAALRKLTAAAADVTDASVGAMTQLSVTADTAVTVANTAKTGLAEVVAADETFYVLITGTTAASTDIALQGVAITVTEA